MNFKPFFFVLRRDSTIIIQYSTTVDTGASPHRSLSRTVIILRSASSMFHGENYPPLPELPLARASIRPTAFINIADQVLEAGSSSLSSSSSASSSIVPVTGGAPPTGSSSSSAASLLAVTPAASRKPDAHPCFDVLKTKTAGTRKLPDRKIMLRELSTDTAVEEFLKTALVGTDVTGFFEALRRSLPVGGKDYGYKLSDSSQDICNFDNLVSRLLPASSLNLPPKLKEFVSYMEQIRSLVAQHKNKEKAKRKVGTQSASQPPKQHLVKLPSRGNSFDPIPCAACNHQYIIVNDNENAINNANRKAAGEHKQAKAEYNNDKRSVRVKGKMPKPPSIESAELVCMCIKMNCAGRFDGKGCYHCQEIVKNHKENGGQGNPLCEHGGCTCEVCQCQCIVVYNRNQTFKLATQVAEEREQQENTSEETGKCMKVCIDNNIFKY